MNFWTWSIMKLPRFWSGPKARFRVEISPPATVICSSTVTRLIWAITFVPHGWLVGTLPCAWYSSWFIIPFRLLLWRLDCIASCYNFGEIPCTQRSHMKLPYSPSLVKQFWIYSNRSHLRCFLSVLWCILQLNFLLFSLHFLHHGLIAGLKLQRFAQYVFMIPVHHQLPTKVDHLFI